MFSWPLWLFHKIRNLFYPAAVLFLSWQRLPAFDDKRAPLTLRSNICINRKRFLFLCCYCPCPLFLPFLFLFVGCAYTCSFKMYLRVNFQSKINIAERHLSCWKFPTTFVLLTWSILHQDASLLTAQIVVFLNKISCS